MPNSFRIKTEIGVNKVLPIKLDQQFDTLEILSLAVFPNDVYIRSCADFGVLCGRVFANRGFGITNARVSVFIPLDELDEDNPVISTLYPYKRTEDFNEDGYKYNLLPYTQSHSGHIPVGTFPDRLDALTNTSVIEVFDKYYKFTAKTNESGDFMIFGLPIGQHNIFMQVDLSDIGEFSLTPQDLIRMGRATETQIDGVKFKFSENYSELPQIVTIEKTIQVAPFYGEKDICDHYIVRTDFDLTTEAGVELKPTSVFMGSIVSHNNRKKIKKRCKVPAKSGWLCDLITGPGQIESIRQTIFQDSSGNPILEEFTLENSGKVIDENGTWVLEVPMNLDYVYTNEDGKKVLSNNPDLGVPTKGKYRFKVKWNQSPKVGEENKRGYFLVPNVKEWGWEDSDGENKGGSVTNTNWNQTSPTKIIADQTIEYNPANPPTIGEREGYLLPTWFINYFAISFQSNYNVESFKVLVRDPVSGEYIENPDYKNYIPLDGYSSTDVVIRFIPIDNTVESTFTYRLLDEGQFKQECSYTFSLNWADYGTSEMINEAINCEDRFYQMSYNKVYTVSQLIDRFGWQTFPQKTIEIKHITESKCEGDYNPFPANDVYYRYDIMFIIITILMKFIVFPILICLIVIYHVLAWLYGIWESLYPVICSMRRVLNDIKCRLYRFYIGPPFRWRPFASIGCDQNFECAPLQPNPFKNLRLGLFIYNDDGCERCKCNVGENAIPASEISQELDSYNNVVGNTSNLVDFTTSTLYEIPNLTQYNPEGVTLAQGNFYDFIPQIFAGGGANLYDWDLSDEAKEATFLLPIASDVVYGNKVLQFSPNLPLGEKLNLFNTKAKYFDSSDPTDVDNDNFSPGAIGWSQTKVVWWPELNSTIDVSGISVDDVGNYTTKYLGQNVWIKYGDHTSLSSTIVYLYNNSSTPEAFPNALNYVEAKVTATILVPAPPGGAVTSPFTILRFSSETSTNIVAPVTPGNNIGGNFIWLYSEDNTTKYWRITDGGETFTSLIGSTIYISPFPGLTLTYYAENNPLNIITLDSDTEVVVVNIVPRPQDGDNYYEAILRLPTGQIIKPSSDCCGNGKWFYKRSTGIKFSFSTTEPQGIYNTYHLDNVLVMLIEDNSIKTGDLFTFQDPGLSQDPNVGKPVGTINEVLEGNNFISVKYCNPIRQLYNQPINNGNLETTYVIPLYERESWVSPFARDLEYFQAISVVSFSAITENRAPLEVAGNNRFSLPWRFLDSSHGKSIKNEVFSQAYSYGCYYNTTQENQYVPTGTRYPYTFLIDGPGDTNLFLGGADADQGRQYNFRAVYEYNRAGEFYTNDFRVYRHQGVDIGDTADYTGMDGINNLLSGGRVAQYSPFTRAKHMASPPQCANADNGLIGGTTDIWSTIDKSRFKIVFFQRGVDPHSPKINVRYDLSRLYGYENYDVNNGQFVIEGEYRMNIPIQGRNGDPIENPDRHDMLGYSLPKHTNFTNNGTDIRGQRLFYPSYLYGTNSASYSGNWETNLHTYYSALDDGAAYYWWLFNRVLQLDIYDDYVLQTGGQKYGLCVGDNTNLFTKTFELVPDSYLITDQGEYVTSLGLNLNDTLVTAHCQRYQICTSTTSFGPTGIGMWFNDFADIPSLDLYSNKSRNNVSGYWGEEYVEGASMMVAKAGVWDTPGGSRIGGTEYYYYFYTLANNGVTRYYSYIQGDNGKGYCNMCNETVHSVGGDTTWTNHKSFEYFSPTYRTVPYDEFAASVWANSAHTIAMSSPTYNVFRTDRLPSSTSFTRYINNGLLMHQNNIFSIYVITDEGVSEQTGGFTLPDQAQASEIDLNELPSESSAVIDSLVNCQFAVNIPCYYVETDGNPGIYPVGPCDGSGAYFVRGMGCYNFVSVPFGSLKRDFRSAKEWLLRTILSFSLCYEVWSHTFSNNWINGTLYHYPFQLNTIFDSNNEPVRDYCRHIIYFHEPNQTFYYRSSPWNGTDFIGKENPERMLPSSKGYGNEKLLMYPTTILDMGPKTNYLQELVYSDEYDGYIISKIPPTSFQNVTDLANVFVLSRLVNARFQSALDDGQDTPNSEGSDDPSVKAYFTNSRWANGDAFFRGLLPSVIDADYSQMLSINSEFGAKEYGPEIYRNTDIYFLLDNIGFAVFGVAFQSDNQDRDYISPRRTIWNDDATIPVANGNFTTIGTNSQKVPSYQWNIRFQYDNLYSNYPIEIASIFGYQSNDFWTSAPSPGHNDPGTPGGSTIFTNGFFYSNYQKLDRFDNFSEYFKTDISNVTKFYKAHIINYSAATDAAGNVILDILGNVSAYTQTAKAPIIPNRRYGYTFGAPFHFYFGLIQGASAMDRFRTKYVDTNIQYE